MSSHTKTTSGGKSSMKQAFLALRNKNCEECPLSMQTDRPCIMGNLPTKRKKAGRLVIVGEGPGRQEEASGLLFSGPAGRLLWETLKKHNLSREHFLITNATRCFPGDSSPTVSQIKTCARAYLDQELEAVQPKYGLLLGNAALQAVIGKKGITKFNAQKIEAMGITWIASVHPAAVLRNPRFRSQFDLAMLQFSKIVYGEHGQPVTDAIEVNGSKDSLRRLINDLKEASEGSIDTETWSKHKGHGRFKGGGLAWWDPTFRLAALSITVKPGTGYTVVLWHAESRWKDPQKVCDILKPHIEGVPEWVFQNGQYDLKTLRRVGISLTMADDTMGMQYVIDENSRKDLGLLSKEYLGAEDYKDTVDKSDMFNAPLEDMVPYAAIDSDYTYRLRSVVSRRLAKDPLSERLYRRLLVPVVNVLSDVEWVGLPINQPKFRRRRKECAKNIEASAAKIFEAAGKEFNIRSTQQLGKVLFDDMGLPVVERTPKGAPSTSEAALIKLADYDEDGVIMPAVLEYRKWAGYMSRYFDSWADLMHNGRLHAHFKPFHTVTGRLSCENPNLQQIARDHFIRGLIGGKRGWRIVEADYSQAELRIAAHLSQDPAMLRAFHMGQDIHMQTAISITGKPEDEIAKEERKMAKSVNFGFLYGMGWKTYIEYAKTKFGVDVTPEQAKFFRGQFFQNYKRLLSWHDRQRRRVRDSLYVISPIGRKRHLWDIKSSNEGVASEAERQAINSPVQSMASDMMLLSMVMLHPMLDPQEARIICTVHDSVLFEVREEVLDEVLPLVKETMENLPLEELFDTILTVPIEVEIKVGKYWSEGAKVVAI